MDLRTDVSYFFSVDELLAIRTVMRTNVAVFTHVGNQLTFAGGFFLEDFEAMLFVVRQIQEHPDLSIVRVKDRVNNPEKTLHL